MELTMNNTMNTDEDYPLLEVTENGLRLLLVGMAPLGLAANTLACLVASKLRNQTSGTAFMKQLAVADSLAVVALSGQSVATGWLQSTSWIANNYTCKTMRFLGGSAMNAGSIKHVSNPSIRTEYVEYGWVTTNNNSANFVIFNIYVEYIRNWL